MKAHAILILALLAIDSSGVAAQRGASPAVQTLTDEYARVDLQAPDRGVFMVTYEVSVTTLGARTLVDPIAPGAVASGVTAIDLMTGAPLQATSTPRSITVMLARPVPANGQGRVRIEKTLTDPRRYRLDGDSLVFTQPLSTRRGSVVLPPGFALSACNVPSQVLSDERGRIIVSYMHQAPGDATLIVRGRAAGAPEGPAAAPRPLTNARSWEPPGQGATERARLTERARQDRDIVYFLQEPSTNAFRLYHDYTESRPGTNTYLNVVRSGSRVSNTSAYVLDDVLIKARRTPR